MCVRVHAHTSYIIISSIIPHHSSSASSNIIIIFIIRRAARESEKESGSTAQLRARSCPQPEKFKGKTGVTDNL